MESELIEKVENNDILIFQKRYKYGAIILTIVIVIEIYLDRSGGSKDHISDWFCILTGFGGLGICLYTIRKVATGKGMPFIEFWNDKIVYRTSNNKEIYEIRKANIVSISIETNEIEIITTNDLNYKIGLIGYKKSDIKQIFSVFSDEIRNLKLTV